LAHTAAVAPVESFGFFSQNTATGQLGLKNSSPFYRLSIRAAPNLISISLAIANVQKSQTLEQPSNLRDSNNFLRAA
ncbi:MULTISPECIES: hypothetical protein, partial [unclassified Moorena]|uniref:hypothetical protein n=1 Tax=unclassified Moorena TaxID=2683338 RepID=UPI0025EAE1D2